MLRGSLATTWSPAPQPLPLTSLAHLTTTSSPHFRSPPHQRLITFPNTYLLDDHFASSSPPPYHLIPSSLPRLVTTPSLPSNTLPSRTHLTHSSNSHLSPTPRTASPPHFYPFNTTSHPQHLLFPLHYPSHHRTIVLSTTSIPHYHFTISAPSYLSPHLTPSLSLRPLKTTRSPHHHLPLHHDFVPESYHHLTPSPPLHLITSMSPPSPPLRP